MPSCRGKTKPCLRIVRDLFNALSDTAGVYSQVVTIAYSCRSSAAATAVWAWVDVPVTATPVRLRIVAGRVSAYGCSRASARCTIRRSRSASWITSAASTASSNRTVRWLAGFL